MFQALIDWFTMNDTQRRHVKHFKQHQAYKRTIARIA